MSGMGETIRIRMEKNKNTKRILSRMRRMGVVSMYHAAQDMVRRKNRQGEAFGRFCDENSESLREVLDMLADERSKRVLRSMLQYRKSYDRKYLKGIVDREQYFDREIIKFSPGETMVDCGAYIGDTMEEFAGRAPDYRHIYAFEPNGRIGEDARKYLKLPEKTYTWFPVGAWSKKETLCFVTDEGGAAHVQNEGMSRIEADSIDNLLSDAPVTFIKMDIEGAEMEALKGAAGVIRTCRPKLAVCIYHNYEDLYQIPMYIKHLVPEYRLFIRQYSDSGAETVLYAVL